ncbi:MAG: AAA family ATPase [Clostridium sp.]|nr:MAG: AAA family ATPase [Clostridium sp.]
MIESLHIQNIALIEDLTLNLEKGLNILSGETGAGKSIIIDSLNFVLGERADKTLIRNGAERAEVSAVFSSVSEDVEKSLEDLGITPDDVLIFETRDDERQKRVQDKRRAGYARNAEKYRRKTCRYSRSARASVAFESFDSRSSSGRFRRRKD